MSWRPAWPTQRVPSEPGMFQKKINKKDTKFGGGYIWEGTQKELREDQGMGMIKVHCLHE